MAATRHTAAWAAAITAAAATAAFAAWTVPYAQPGLLALVAAANLAALPPCLAAARRAAWRGPGTWPLIALLAGPLIALALPWNAWRAARLLDANRADYARVAAAAAHGDLGETTHAGPRWVRLPAPDARLAAGGEIHVRRDADGAWIWFPLYITPWFGGGGGLRWEIHADAPDGAWRYHAR